MLLAGTHSIHCESHLRLGSNEEIAAASLVWFSPLSPHMLLHDLITAYDKHVYLLLPSTRSLDGVAPRRIYAPGFLRSCGSHGTPLNC